MLAALSASGAEIDDSQTIGLFCDEQPVVATSPIPRPISRIAENVTVITADDIARLNAHTLAEILQTVPGIQLDYQRTPSTFTFFNIQGALNSTVLVLIDGIRQNDFDQNMVAPGLIPVQQIERIEIIKGAASGSWVSALGGVVNIVTKSPNQERPVSGMVSSSDGSRFTSDSRVELSGSERSLGYYLTAGHLRSDGLTPNTGARMENLYGKLSYPLPHQGTVTAGVSNMHAAMGTDEGMTPLWGFVHDDGENRHTYGFLRVQQPLANRLGLDVLGYATGREDEAKYGGRTSQGAVFFTNDFAVNDHTRGARATLSWGDSRNNLVFGGEYFHVSASQADLLSFAPPAYDRDWDSYATFLNGTISVGELSVVPGVRFDSTGVTGDHTSYSLGLTYQLTDRTTLRAYAADGFSLPMLSALTGTQKVTTAQGGIESDEIPLLWLKGTYFFNKLRNAESVGPVASVTATDQIRQGLELEARTTPFHGIALAGGYTYLYAEDEEAEKRLLTNSQQTVPSQLYKLAVYYDQADIGVRGALTGSGVAWNQEPGYPARAAGMIWDLNLNWKPNLGGALAPELFFSAHNLLDAIQTTNTVLYTNASRWYEGGARLRF